MLSFVAPLGFMRLSVSLKKLAYSKKEMVSLAEKIVPPGGSRPEKKRASERAPYQGLRKKACRLKQDDDDGSSSIIIIANFSNGISAHIDATLGDQQQ